MDVLVLSSILLFVFSMLSLGTGIYAFYKSSVTQSERLFVVGMSMIIAAMGILCGSINDSRLLPFNFGWAWYTGTSLGFFCLFLSSIMTSVEQFRMLKRWEIIMAALLITVLVLTPALPAYPNSYVPIFLNTIRTILCSLGLFRYLRLYTSKGTRFSLLMCLAFLFITIGYAVIIPQLLDPTLAVLLIVGVIIRILGVATLFAAFAIG